MNEILAQWWAFGAGCAVIVWAIRRSNIGEYDCIDIEYEVQDIHVGGTYCKNPYWDIVNKDVKVCGGTDWPRKGMPMIEFVRNQSTFVIEDDGLFRERLREFGTKRAFCLAANISADTLNKILNDKGVNYDTAVKVAEALGLYWEDLFYPDTYQTKVVKTKGRGQIASS